MPDPASIDNPLTDGNGQANALIAGDDPNSSFHVQVRTEEVRVNYTDLDKLKSVATAEICNKRRKRTDSGADASDHEESVVGQSADLHDGLAGSIPEDVELELEEEGSSDEADERVEPIPLSEKQPLAGSELGVQSASASGIERVIDTATRLSLSKLWEWQRAYFEQATATTSFVLPATSREVGRRPTLASSNAVLAHEYARLVAAYIRDMLASGMASPEQAGSQQPFYIVELGAGSGSFAWMFLNQFISLAKQYRLLDLHMRMSSEETQTAAPANLSSLICYVLTDSSASAVESYRRSPQLATLVQKGILDFAQVDAENFTSVHLLERNLILTSENNMASTKHGGDTEVTHLEMIAASTNTEVGMLVPDPHALSKTRTQVITRPLIAIATYLFSILPQDAFRVTSSGALEEVRPTLWQRPENLDDSIERLDPSADDQLKSCSISWDAIPLAAYTKFARKQRKAQLAELKKLRTPGSSPQCLDNSAHPSRSSFMYYTGNLSLVNEILDDIVSSAAVMYDVSMRTEQNTKHDPVAAARLATKLSKPRLALIPTGALKCIECLRALAPKRFSSFAASGEPESGFMKEPLLMVLFGDKCSRSSYSNLTTARSSRVPLSYHGCISFPVNTALLKLYCELRGGKFYTPLSLSGDDELKQLLADGTIIEGVKAKPTLPPFSTCGMVFGGTLQTANNTADSYPSTAKHPVTSEIKSPSIDRSRVASAELQQTPQSRPTPSTTASTITDDPTMKVLTPAQRRASLVHQEILRSASIHRSGAPQGGLPAGSSTQVVESLRTAGASNLLASVRSFRAQIVGGGNEGLGAGPSSAATPAAGSETLNDCRDIGQDSSLYTCFEEAFSLHEDSRESALANVMRLHGTLNTLLTSVAAAAAPIADVDQIVDDYVSLLATARYDPSSYAAIVPGLIQLIDQCEGRLSPSTVDRILNAAAESLKLYFRGHRKAGAGGQEPTVDLFFETARLALSLDVIELAEECCLASLEDQGGSAEVYWNLALCRLRKLSSVSKTIPTADREWLLRQLEKVLKCNPTPELRDNAVRLMARLVPQGAIVK